MLMVSIALVMGVIVTNIHLRKYTKSTVPDFIIRRIVRCPCSRANSRGRVKSGSGRKTNQIGRHVDTEVDIGAAFEMESLTNRPRVRINGMNSVKGENCSYVYSPREGGDDEANEQKIICICQSPEAWSELAKFVDKAFFYSFLLTSMMTFFFIFYQVPSHSVRSGIDVHPDIVT